MVKKERKNHGDATVEKKTTFFFSFSYARMNAFNFALKRPKLSEDVGFLVTSAALKWFKSNVRLEGKDANKLVSV